MEDDDDDELLQNETGDWFGDGLTGFNDGDGKSMDLFFQFCDTEEETVWL